MTLVEGIGDEVIQFFIALFFFLIVGLAWCTTNISNDRTLRTVFLLERRQFRSVRRLTNHTESTTIVPGSTEEDMETEQTVASNERDKPSETASASNSPEQSSQVVDEEARIVETMDSPRDPESILRRRRLAAFYSRTSENKMENRTENITPCDDRHGISADAEHNCPKVGEISQNESGCNTLEETDRICVKLMYLNDELRQVDGRLQEKLGDFKRRHFQVEIAANKLVKLIFNGHVLQQDSNTLQGCGLFDNCVVHCLVHQRSNIPSQDGTLGSRGNSSSSTVNNAHTNNNNQPYEWHLENYLFLIVCCILGAAWYLRYVYAHLYTVTATIGLILMTGIFSIIVFGLHFPDDDLNQRERTGNTQSRQ